MTNIKITNVDINCSDVLLLKAKGMDTEVPKDALRVTLALSERNEAKEKTYNYLITLTLEQILKVASFKEKIHIENTDRNIKLMWIEGIESIVAALLQFALKARMIAVNEYVMYCIEHLIYYTLDTRKYNDINYEKGVEFFHKFVPYGIQKKFEYHYDEFIRKSAYPMVEKLESIASFTEKVGGQFYGCYTDDEGRVRPLTSRVQRVTKYYKWAELIAALSVEIGYCKSIESYKGVNSVEYADNIKDLFMAAYNLLKNNTASIDKMDKTDKTDKE